MYVLLTNNDDFKNARINSDIDDDVYKWNYGLGDDHVKDEKMKSFHDYLMFKSNTMIYNILLKKILNTAITILYLDLHKVIGILLIVAVVYSISNTHLMLKHGLKIQILDLSHITVKYFKAITYN